jgi:RNA recognition motif-containing protein
VDPISFAILHSFFSPILFGAMGKRNDANALPRRGDGASHHQKVTTGRKEESMIVAKAPIIDSACKVFVNRIPATFTEESIVRLIQESVPGLPPDSIRDVSLVYENENDEKETNNAADVNNDDDDRRATSNKKKSQPAPHKGYAFLHLATAAAATILLQQQTIRGSATANSKKKHTIYLSAVADDRNAATFICFLWQQRRCPYGESCKFRHVGDGACGGPVVSASSSASTAQTTLRAKTKCWEYLKKGSCRQGDDCLFWHSPPEEQCTTITGVATTTTTSSSVVVDKEKTKRPDSEKDCINWKTKGKCRKRETTTCPYRHDDSVRGKVLAKKQAEQQQTNMKRPMKAGSENESLDGGPPTKKKKKTKQPLSVRVFGLNYESTMTDVQDLFADCGAIQKVTFPTFDDSGRSKGYCEVLFTSPQAVDQALLLHETELHGRWLSVQAGKMLERQWQDNHTHHHRGAAAHEDGDGFLQE